MELVLKDEVEREGGFDLWVPFKVCSSPTNWITSLKDLPSIKKRKFYSSLSEIRLLQNWIIQIPRASKLSELWNISKWKSEAWRLTWKCKSSKKGVCAVIIYCFLVCVCTFKRENLSDKYFRFLDLACFPHFSLSR